MNPNILYSFINSWHTKYTDILTAGVMIICDERAEYQITDSTIYFNENNKALIAL